MLHTFTLPFNLIVTLGFSPIAKQRRPFLRLEGKVILFILFYSFFFLNGEDNFPIKEQKRVLVQLKDVLFAKPLLNARYGKWMLLK